MVLQVNTPFSFSTRISTSLTSVRVKFLTIKVSIDGFFSEGVDTEQAEKLIVDKHMASVENKRVEVIVNFIVYVFSVMTVIALIKKDV